MKWTVLSETFFRSVDNFVESIEKYPLGRIKFLLFEIFNAK